MLRIDPGTESVALARAMRYLRDRSLELDAATAVRKARAGEFQPLPRGRPVFGFQRGAFWFFLRIENADPWEPRVRGRGGCSHCP
ncbi:MAG: 7TM-DISM domain-containing protein [Xanthomonadales bacterium]|nr:7TM-DISM domain-containing protein [Xanthomonadales bacterium]